RKMSLASGVIPQISAVLGQCGGGLAVAAGLSDFVFMDGKAGKLFVNAPNALAGNKTEDTACAAFQSEHTGLVDFVGTPDEIFAQIRALVPMLPANNSDEA
ncbi:MAG TPA: carboxyl transferase, partial [Lachnospiraceae bacterium]|nr:carboxyl transferase [Lachnospiraceae bacterium]